MSRFQNREHLREWVGHCIKVEQLEIDKFTEELKTSPLFAFEWSDNAMIAAAKIEVLKSVDQTLKVEVPNETPEEFEKIREYLIAKLIQKAWHTAQYPPSSTSGVSNIANQKLAAACVWLLDRGFNYSPVDAIRKDS